ncbi:MAG: dicarboxylate/amino acid:cation symporter, partial [Bacilli bacterium]|nr:dicarboxylate/amino acid:cation symporter [Bacilli bacterium]
MKKIGLLPRLIVGIMLGIVFGSFLPKPFIEVFATFNGVFGNFLNFAIPLIIIGFVVPGIGDLGKGAGKTLAITALLAYVSTVLSGIVTYFTGVNIFPNFLKVGSLALSADNPEKSLVEPLFKISMPPVMDVMTALVLSFTLGLGIAVIKGDKIKSIFDEFQQIISKLIESIIIPLLPFYVMG